MLKLKPWYRSFLEKPVIFHMLKEIAFYKTRIFTAVFTRLTTRPVYNHMTLVYTFTPSLFKIHFNIIFQYFPRFSKWSLPFRYSFLTTVLT